MPWKTTGEINVSQPIIDHNRVFISSGYGVGAALLDISEKEPRIIWQNKNMRTHFNSCVLWQGFIYGPDDDRLCCMSFDTGEVKWTDRSVGKGSLMMADGKLIVLSEKGELMVAEALARRSSSPCRASRCSRANAGPHPCCPMVASIAATPRATWFAWMCQGNRDPDA